MQNTDYSVTSIKTFRGMEGQGYNATLLRAGKKIATLIDDAHGGGLMIEWLDYDAARVQGQNRTYTDEVITRMMTPEEARLNAIVFAMPQRKCEYSKSGLIHESVDAVLEDLVNVALSAKRLTTMLKSKIVFVKTDGNVYSAKLTNPAHIDMIANRPDTSIVLNKLSFADALALAVEKRIA